MVEPTFELPSCAIFVLNIVDPDHSKKKRLIFPFIAVYQFVTRCAKTHKVVWLMIHTLASVADVMDV